MTKHTPGPWRAEIDNRMDMRVESHRTVAHLPIPYPARDHSRDDEMKANARLIAAAPDMLDALKDALMVLQSAAAADPTWTQAAMARDDVSAAIAKAEGRDQ